MPLYEYKCGDCGNEYEELVGINQKEAPPCPHCGSSKTQKRMSVFGGISGGHASSTSGSSCGGRSGFT